MKSINVSATHRRFATSAVVDHEIDHAVRDKPVICVINRLGKKCETTTIGETIASTDTYGNPNTKKTSEGQGRRRFARVLLPERERGRERGRDDRVRFDSTL